MSNKKEKKVKKKPRNVLAKKLDVLYPIDITKLGTEEDPCFGKFFDPQAPECQRCGDCEICQIALNQNSIIKRGKLEETTTFRDIGEKEIYGVLDNREVKVHIRKLVRSNKKIDKDSLIKQTCRRFTIKEPKKVEKILKSMLKTTKKFKLTKNTLIWLPK